MKALESAANIITMAPRTTHIVTRYLAGEKRFFDRSPPCHPLPPGFLPLGPGNFPPEPVPFLVTVLVLVTIAAITACYFGARVCLHHEVLRSPRHRKFIRPSIDCWSDPGE